MSNKEIFLVNKRQVAFYTSKGVQPIRLELTNDEEHRLVFVYLVEDTTLAWREWKANGYKAEP